MIRIEILLFVKDPIGADPVQTAYIKYTTEWRFFYFYTYHQRVADMDGVISPVELAVMRPLLSSYMT